MLENFNLNLFFCFGNTAEDCEIAVSSVLTLLLPREKRKKMSVRW